MLRSHCFSDRKWNNGC